MTPKTEPTYRHELKYLVSSAQMALLRMRINGLMQPDPHIMKNGKYTIRSLYFDDYANRCFYENESGIDHRAKYRIRSYNFSSERISLELKKKDRGKTLKESCLLTKDQADFLIKGNTPREIATYPKLLQGLCADMMINRMRPAVIVEYERIPFIYKNGNVRVTFDTAISSSAALNEFWKEAIPKRPVLPVGIHLLEVKFDEYLPDVIYRALQIDNLQQTAFSKYYLCRKFSR